ncbi:MAG: hypothetical protein H0V89_11420, partial [Deltaproteobacteria bacterium]|nr:hypothetical protein [Deltaproteobacteria bacterium]
SPLPVAPAGVVAFELVRLGVARWWMVPCALIALAPLAFAAPGLWVSCAVVLLAVQLAALPAGAVGALVAIEVSEAPGWQPILDALRGQNPRIQAALLWAPGAVLAIVGAAGAMAAFTAVEGNYAWVLAPLLVGAVLALQIPRLAGRAWFRGTPLLQEIDARYATLERPEDVGRVYLDWAVRWLRPPVSTWALADLRHGWRARRSWITGAWAGGIAAGLAGWSAASASVATAAALGAAAAWLCAAISGWMERDVPPFTRLILPDRGVARLVARLLVVVAWLQPIAWIPVFPVAVRHGLDDALGLLGFVELSIVLSAALAAVFARVGLGLVGYAPIAVIAAGVAAAAGGRLWT